jgi:hypothetical protein
MLTQSLGGETDFAFVVLESDCMPAGAYAKIGANNLAIPVDARQVRFVRLTLVPATSPSAIQPGTAPAIKVDLISIGYTMP